MRSRALFQSILFSQKQCKKPTVPKILKAKNHISCFPYIKFYIVMYPQIENKTLLYIFCLLGFQCIIFVLCIKSYGITLRRDAHNCVTKVKSTDSAIYQIDHPKKYFLRSKIKRILNFRSISNQLHNLIFLQGGVILDQFQRQERWPPT